MHPLEIFRTITNALRENPNFPIIVKSEGSFEQWINWEAYAACITAGYECVPNPSYKNWGGTDDCLFGDLLVVDKTDGTKVMVETKIIGDYTLDKYVANINDDRKKLEGLNPSYA